MNRPSVSAGPVVQLPTPHGPFICQAWTDPTTGAEHLSLTAATRTSGAAPLVRLHSECLTGDVFGSFRCDCGEQLAYSLAVLQREGGTLLYLRGQEGRGIGLANKMRAYALQEQGADTVEANEQLGLPVDGRDYAAAAEILHALGLRTIRLLSNNPVKRTELLNYGIDVAQVVPVEVAVRKENRRYLETKRDRMHHALHLNQSTTPSKGAVQ